MDLPNNYTMVADPHAKEDGGLIIIQQDAPRQKDGKIQYEDPSMTVRQPNYADDEKWTSQAEKRQKDKDDKTKSNLTNDSINVKNPLSSADWDQIREGVKNTQGLAYVQVPPVGQKSSQPLQFNSIHLVPGEKLASDDQPLFKAIESKVDEFKEGN